MSPAEPVIAESDRCPICGAAVDESWLICAWCGGQLATAAELSRGAELDGRYRIEHVLGRGGFGITYAAYDQRLQRRVAIKELFPPSAVRHGSKVLVEPRDRADFVAARVRFQREAAALARFSHPGIVRVYEVFEGHNTAYLVMELLEGRSLFQVLTDRGEPMEVDEVLDIVLRVGGALSAVHEAGLLHRDINPTNVMLDPTGRIVLIDFGLARSFGDQVSANVTRAVTPGYAPPEQYAGSSRFGPPCDVYGLAATAYKLLTGTTPLNVVERQSGATMPTPHELVDAIPPLVGHAVLDGMELNPDHRPASAQAFLDRLGLHDRVPGPRALLSSSSPPRARDDTGVDVGDLPRPATPDAPAAAHAWPPPAPAPLVDSAAHRVDPGRPGPPPQVLDLPVSRGRAPFAPWHDGSAPVVGPGVKSRAWVTVPLAVAALALASSTPIAIGVLLALIVLPATATLGDLEVHRNRLATGAARRNWHHAEARTVAPMLFGRNIAVGALRAVPAAAIAAIGVVASRSIGHAGTTGVWRDISVRLCGCALAASLLVPARHGGRTFRSDLGISAVAAWAMEGRPRPSTRTVVVWVILVFLTALGAWLHPELWPISG